MTVQLSRLKAQLEGDSSSYVRAADQAAAAAEKLGRATAGMGRQVEESERKVVESASGLAKLQRQLDPLERAIVANERAEKTLTRARDLGKISADQYAAAQEKLRQRLEATALAAAKAERAQRAAAASGNSAGLIGAGGKVDVDAYRKLVDAQDNVGKSSSRMNQALQQSGAQISDVAAQVASGGNAISALGMQLGQLLQVFGPLGAIIGAGITLLGMYAATLFDTSEAAKKAKEAEEDWKEALEFSRQIAEEAEETQKRLNEQKRQSSIDTAKDTIKLRENTQALLEQEIAAAQAGAARAALMKKGTTAEAAGVVDVGTQRAEQRIANMQDQLLKLGASTKEARDALERLLNPPDTWNNPELVRQRKEADQAAEALAKASKEEEARRVKTIDQLTIEQDERMRLLDATRQGEDAITALNRELEAERAARELLGVSTSTQARLIMEANPHIAEQVLLTQKLTRENYDLQQAIDKEADARKAADKAREESAKKAEREAERYQKEIQRSAERISDDVAETIYDGLTGKGDSVISWFKSLFRRIAVEALASRIILPIAASVVGAAPGMFGITGSAGSGTAAGGSAISGAGGQLLQSAGGQAMNLMSGAGSAYSTLMGTTLINGTTTGAITQSGSLAAAYSAPSTIAGSAGGLTVGGALGAAGVGYAAGGLVGGWIGNATGSKVAGGAGGAVSGAAAGAALGSVVPGIGTLAGAIVGGIAGLLGGVLGTASKPSNKEGNSTVDLRTGAQTTGGQTGDKFSQENRDAATSAAQTYGQIAKLLGQFAGQQVTGSLKVAMGNRDGMVATVNGASTSFARDEAGVAKMSKWITDTLAQQVGATLPGDIKTALQRIDWRDLEQAISDINFAGAFQESLKALRGDIGLFDQSTAATKAEVAALTEQITTFRETAARLGLDTAAANDATRSYVEALLGLREVAAPLTETESAVELLRVRFAEMGPLLAAVGIAAEEAGAGFNRALAAMAEDYVAGLDREFNSLAGNDWINAIDDSFALLEQRARDAAALGSAAANDAALRNNHQNILNILNDLSDEDLGEAAQRYGGEIAGLAAAIQASRVVLEEAAPAVEAAVFDTAGWLRDLAREAESLAGNDFINQISDQFALMNERLAIAQREGVGFNEVLSNNHAAMEAILRDLSNDQLNDAANRFGGGIAAIASSLIAARQAATEAEAALAAQEAAARAAQAASEAAAQAAARIADQRAGLERELLEAMGDTAEIRRLELAAMDESLRPLQQRIWALGDEAAAAQAAAQASEAAARADQERAAVLAQGVADARSALQSAFDAAIGTAQGTADAAAERAQAARAAVQAAFDREISAAQSRAAVAQQRAQAARAAVQQAFEAEMQRISSAAAERLNAARAAVQDAFGREISAQQEIANTAASTGQRLRGLAESLADFQKSLVLQESSPLSPEARYQESRSQFESIAGRAAAGDEAAIGQLQQASTAFLDQSRQYFASSDQYARDFARVQAMLAQAQAGAAKQASAAEQQAAAATKQAETLQAQLNAALGISATVATIPAALKELQTAKSASDQAERQVSALQAQLNAALGLTATVGTIPGTLKELQAADRASATADAQVSTLQRQLASALHMEEEVGTIPETLEELAAADQASALAAAQVLLLQQQLAAELGTTSAVMTIPAALAQLAAAIGAQQAASQAAATRAAEQAAAAQASAAQSAARSGSLGAEAQVAQAYKDILGRTGEASGVAHWTNVANTSGMAAALSGILASPEAKARGYEDGGIVGNGTWGKDSVRARFAGGGDIMLAGGEHVTRASAVNSNTMATLAYINRTGRNPGDGGDTVAELRALREDVRALIRVSAAAGDDNNAGLQALNKRLGTLERKARLGAAA